MRLPHFSSRTKFLASGLLLALGLFFLWYSAFRPGKTVYAPETPAETALDEAPKGSDEVTLPEGDETLPAPSHAEDSSEENATPLEQGENPSSPEVPEEKAETPASETKLAVVDRLMQSGFAARPSRAVDTIIIHSTYNNTGGDRYSVSKIIGIYESYGVSAHYLIDREGTIYRLVREKDISYHAGVSRVPDGRKDVNDFSIGIELINATDDEYTSAQYRAVKKLVSDIKARYRIKYVLGHDDIAPGRKTDPWNFDWSKLK
jgi:N-acetylmuramoyl-L-alanine amidase CwlA